MMDDDQFIDNVSTQAKQMLRDLRAGVAMDGDTPIQSASEFLAERLDDPPGDEHQLASGSIARFVARRAAPPQ